MPKDRRMLIHQIRFYALFETNIYPEAISVVW